MKKILELIKNNINYLFIIIVAIVLLFALLNGGGISMKSHFVLGMAIFPLGLLFFLQRKKQLLTSGIRRMVEIILWLFLGFFLLSFWFTKMSGYGIGSLVSIVSGILLFFMISRMPISRREIGWLLQGIVFVAGISSILGGIAYAVQGFDRFAGTFWEIGRIYDAFPNAWANFLILILPINIYFLFIIKTKLENFLFGINLALILSGLFLSFSRGAWLTLTVLFFIALFVLIWGISVFTDIRRQVLRVGIFIALSVFLTFGIQGLRDKAQEITFFTEKVTLNANEGMSSLNERLDFWRGSLEIIKKNPVFGSGPDSFQFVFPVFQKELLAISPHPHNLFLKIASENGLIAASLLVLFFVLFAIIILSNLKRIKPGRKALSIALIFSITGALIHNTTDFNLNFIANSLLFWFFCGILFSFVNQETQELWEHLLHFKRKYLAWMMLVCGIFVAFFSAHETVYSYYLSRGRAFGEAQEYKASFEEYLKARELYFPRELYRSIGQTALDIFEETNKKDYVVQASGLLSDWLLNNKTEDALFYDTLALLYLKTGDTAKIEDAEGFLSSAVLLDPKNYLRIYYDLLEAWRIMDRTQLINSTVPMIEVLLDKYYEKLAVNAHLTINTDNPEFALKIYDFLTDFGKKNGFPKDKLKGYETKRNQMFFEWMSELDQFKNKYNLQ